jgi:hypothetical protein
MHFVMSKRLVGNVHTKWNVINMLSIPLLSHLSIKCTLNTEEKQQATFIPTEHSITAATQIFKMLSLRASD